ncbi:hypothetical protein IPM19_03940 [bacterium]|nr:MAG: hypothetical protein IPM19_03940 [bacterium]
MNKYRVAFGSKKTLLAVVHCEDVEHSIRNTRLAKENGAHGVFLINHNFGPKELMENYRAVRTEFPDYWIGINLLGVSLKNIFDYATRHVNGIWTDNAGVPDEEWKRTRGKCQADDFLKETSNWPGIYFGGTAFKYTHQVNDDPATAAENAMAYMDVITTSGSGTGSAPMVDKLKAMRKAVGNFPIANASGNSLENAIDFCEHVDCLITASSLLKTKVRTYGPDEFDPDKIYQMVRLLEQLSD